MPDFTPPRLLLGDLAGLEDALCQQVAEIRNERPLSPVTVLIENTMLRQYLRRRLAEPGRGHINVQIITPARLADRFTRELLVKQNRQPLPKYGDRILARRVAETSAGSYFRPVAYSSGFAETLRGLFREFAQAGIDPGQLRSAVGALQSDGTEKLNDLATLYEQFERRRSRFFTPDDLVAAVNQADQTRIESVTRSPVFVYGIWNPSAIQYRLFHWMMSAGIELRFLLPETGTDADDAHGELREWLGGLGVETEVLDREQSGSTALDQLHSCLFGEFGEPVPEDGSVRLLSAPDAPREVREAARTCLRWAEAGIPFHRMAVVYRHTEPYRTLIDQIFQKAGIVTYLHSGRPLIAEPTGQRLSTLVNLIGSEMTRSSVMEFLTETVLPEETRDQYDDRTESIKPARWDQLSREAGIVQGRDQWQYRLELLESARREFTDPDAEVDDDAPIDPVIWEIARFRRFITDFADALEGAAEEATWTEHLEYLSGLARKYIDDIEDLVDQLSTLSSLEQIDAKVSFERFRETVRHWLLRQNSARVNGGTGDDHRLASGQFVRSGVNVFDIGSLRQLRFDAVIILGVAERQFPPPPRQDPLLLDRERARLNAQNGWRLPLRSQRSEEEAMIFTMAVQAARQRLQISFPRSEAGSTRSYLPSHFFRAVASVLEGREVEASEIDRVSEAHFTRVPSGSFRPPSGSIPLDEHEYDRILLEQDRELGIDVVGTYRPGIPRGRRAEQSRESRAFTSFDGRLEPASARQIAWTAGRDRRAISPSRLETFATCPFRYFLQYVLRLEPVEEPETLERIGALERGSLIHEVLERFLQHVRARNERPSPAKREEHLAALNEIARDACQQMEGTGLVGYPVLWEYDQIAIFEDLEEWYDREVIDLSQTDLQPETFELRFGWARRKDEGGAGSRDRPFRLRLDGGEPLSFQGRVDRVDIHPGSGRFRVIDYKTGRKRSSYQPNTFNGGRSVQLPIYLLAAADLLDMPWQDSEAQYYFPTRIGEYQRVEMSGAWLQENHDDLVDLLRGIVQAIETGIFPQVTNKGNNCRFCNFKDLCPAGVSRIAGKKTADPAVASLRQLIETDEP